MNGGPTTWINQTTEQTDARLILTWKHAARDIDRVKPHGTIVIWETSNNVKNAAINFLVFF